MKKQDSSALFGVIGLGRFGSALARTLAEAGKEVPLTAMSRRSRLFANILTMPLW